MIIYEVNLKVKSEQANEFECWLHHHIEEMLQIDGFIEASLSELDSEDSEYRLFTSHYYLNSSSDLDNYFSSHAERMRGDGLSKFGKDFSASRRILTCIKRFNSRL